MTSHPVPVFCTVTDPTVEIQSTLRAFVDRCPAERKDVKDPINHNMLRELSRAQAYTNESWIKAIHEYDTDADWKRPRSALRSLDEEALRVSTGRRTHFTESQSEYLGDVAEEYAKSNSSARESLVDCILTDSALRVYHLERSKVHGLLRKRAERQLRKAEYTDAGEEEADADSDVDDAQVGGEGRSESKL